MADDGIQISMEPEEPQAKGSLQPGQICLLLFLLIGYPLISVGMSLLSHTDATRLTSRISQIYLPSLLIELIILTLVIMTLRRTGTSLAGIGLSKEDFNWANVISALIFFVGAWAMITLIRGAILRSGYIPEKDFMYLLPRTLGERVFWVLLSIGAAFSEEIAFRGYIVTRLRILTGRYWLGAVVSSIAFSLGHLYQGMAGVILTFIYGLLFAGLFVARKSIVPGIIAHFLQDALVLAALLFI
jgi:uncharacterized protein